MTDADRLEALEIKCAHLERAVQELSDVLYRQQQALDRALRHNQALASQLEALEVAVEPARGPHADLPPHY